jgi:inner membrane protein
MDPVCHTLAGAAIGEAGLKKRTPLGMATLMLAANLPDVDALVWATDALHVHVRRGWTHGPVGLAVLPVALAVVMFAWDRLIRQRRAHAPPPASWRGLLLLSYVGALTHPFLDFLNSYGIRWLMPFSERWYYGDALFIVDPWMYLFLGGAVVAARWRARRVPGDGPGAARVGVGVAAVYIGLMLASNVAARSVVRAGLDRAGVPAGVRFMVTPVFANPFAREVFVDMGMRYEKGFVTFAPWPRFRPAGYGITVNADDPAVAEAVETVLGRQFLGWSRFPFYVVERQGGEVVVHIADARYSGPAGDGWARVSIPVTKRDSPLSWQKRP